MVQDNRALASLERLLGKPGIASLQNSHVVVVGIGGVGSWAAEALARSGVGRITLIDFDHISPSNLNRQVHALHSTLGQSKVMAMQARMMDIFPGLSVQVIDDFVSVDNWPGLLAGQQVDAVVDCCDQFSAKLAMVRWFLGKKRHKSPHFICVGAAGGKRQAHAVAIADLGAVTHDPLLAKLRYQVRRAATAPSVHQKKSITRLGVVCVYSPESVLKPVGQSQNMEGGAALNCAGYGSIVTVTATFGMVAANWVINRLVEGSPRNQHADD